MGERSVETVREIEETREKLEGKLLALEERMPALTPAKRVVGLAVGGGMGGTIFWFAVKRVRARKRKKEAVQPVNAVINLVPDNLATKMEELMAGERAKQWALGFAGVWVLLKIAEIRQLRALRRAQMA
ncbi:MAG TPA: hypothetical protein VFF00_01825 [Candidatus Elarobacter sp.]|nr:MAG: hypothetical protein E6G04_06450 [Actinomycetota bacterium]HZW52738.1 hypothetical protein [Candidatus Elarobacter sp.]